MLRASSRNLQNTICTNNSPGKQYITEKGNPSTGCPFFFPTKPLLVIYVPDLFPQVDAGAVDLFGVDREIGVFVADFTQSYL